VIWSIVAATLVGALLRFFHLGHPSLWIDEVFTWYAADVGAHMPWSHVLENVHGPLYTLILHSWAGVAGDGEWAMRFPSAVFGTLAVPSVAWLAGRWLGRSSAIPAAWLAAGSPFLVWYSQEARNYAMLIPCVALGAVAMLELRERLSARALVGFLASSSVGLLTNFSYMLIAPLHLYWWLAPRADRRRRMMLLAGVGLLLTVVLFPWLPRLTSVWDWKRLTQSSVQGSTEALRGGPSFHVAAYPFTLHAFAVGYTLGPSIREIRMAGPAAALKNHLAELAIVTLLFGVLGVLAFRAAIRRRVLIATLIALIVPALFVTYGAMRNFKTFHPRYVAVSFPFLLALVAAALADARPRLRAALGAALVLTWGVSLFHLYFVPSYGKEDMRDAVAVVNAHAAAGEKILVAGADDVLFYYYRGPLPVERYWLGWAGEGDRMEAKLNQALAGTRGVWLVWSRGEDLDPSGRFPRFLDQRYPGAESYRFEGVRLWHLAGAAPAAP
jgi:uncharacterized membrane protein